MSEQRGQLVDSAGAARMPDPTPEPEPTTVDEPSLISRNGYIRHAAAQLAVDYYKEQGVPKTLAPQTVRDTAEVAGECIVILAKKIEGYLRGAD